MLVASCWAGSAAARMMAAAGGHTCRRELSAISGKHNPFDVLRETNPMLHQQDTRTEAEAGAFEARVPGVASFVEPGVPKPGTVQPPNPSPQLLELVPIAKVTHDGDAVANKSPDAPAAGLPRS